MRFQAGEVSAGALHLAFGRVPGSYFDQGIRPDEDFRDIYYRVYLRNQVSNVKRKRIALNFRASRKGKLIPEGPKAPHKIQKIWSEKTKCHQ